MDAEVFYRKLVDHPIKITSTSTGYHLRYWDPDFTHDLKLLPACARRWLPEIKAWWIDVLYINCVYDFILGHYGVDLTPERNKPTRPTIETIAPRAEVYFEN